MVKTKDLEKMSEVEYKEKFGIQPPNRSIQDKALQCALDIRKYEIQLYWERAKYFWTLIAGAFGGYFAINSMSNASAKYFPLMIVASLGMVLTFAWYNVNRGSKFWQENWENHVDSLEDAVMGPLYKTVLMRPKNGKSDWITRNITGPKQISVSKINILVSLYVLLVWLILFVRSLDIAVIARVHWPIAGKIAISIVTVSAFAVMIWRGRTDKCNYQHVAEKRETTIDKALAEWGNSPKR